MDLNEISNFVGKVRKIKAGDKMAGRNGHKSVISIAHPQTLKMDLIMNRNTGEMYSVHYLKKAIFTGDDSNVLKRDKEYYILSENEQEYIVLVNDENELSFPKHSFKDV